MFSFVADYCIAPQKYDIALDDDYDIETYGPRWQHWVAHGMDMLLSITLLVVGLLSLMHPSLGIGLSSAGQWAFICVGATSTAFLFMQVLHIVKAQSRFTASFLIGTISSDSSSSSSYE